jgi:uncharacterized repeat protein (TIGR04042 family)
MPEMNFVIRWPDETTETCYSPSLVIKDHFTQGQSYALKEFVDRARTALSIASDRVEAKYGMACGHALSQIAEIEMKSVTFSNNPDARVTVVSFDER